MNEMYKELLVSRESTVGGKIAKYAMVTLAVIFLVLGMTNIIFMIIAVLLIAGSYYLHMNTNLEYEYLYVDKELSVDKIMAKSRRKKLESFSIERMQIMAPVKSYHLDAYKNTDLKVTDYSSRNKLTESQCYAMVYEGNRKILFEAPRDFMKAIYQVAPRKVFFD